MFQTLECTFPKQGVHAYAFDKISIQTKRQFLDYRYYWKSYCKHTALCSLLQIILKQQLWENAKQPDVYLPKKAKQTKNKNKSTQQWKSLE